MFFFCILATFSQIFLFLPDSPYDQTQLVSFKIRLLPCIISFTSCPWLKYTICCPQATNQFYCHNSIRTCPHCRSLYFELQNYYSNEERALNANQENLMSLGDQIGLFFGLDLKFIRHHFKDFFLTLSFHDTNGDSSTVDLMFPL
ncbi:unnamed protein product [Blepharisma stoltei]|uniref:Uncharacterized protein n=1 Tax=Blepharisma stoltei TaxID=1481888 RepID=A0AAU9JMA9_9CILI|nr:unnamed protein product [Blepharisma stoltei]